MKCEVFRSRRRRGVFFMIRCSDDELLFIVYIMNFIIVCDCEMNVGGGGGGGVGGVGCGGGGGGGGGGVAVENRNII